MKNKDFKQLNIIYTEHDRVWSYCPFHKDIIRPNLSISLLDKYYGKCKCWACGKGGCLNKKQMGDLNLSGCIVYRNNTTKLSTRWMQFIKNCYDNLQKFPLLQLGLAKQLNVSVKSLDDWLVGYDGVSFTIPMYREDLREYDNQYGSCGAQRRFPDGTKRSVTGSHLGLMYPHENIRCMPTFVCEGFSDGISVYDLGLNSMARPHCWYTDGVNIFFKDILEYAGAIVIVPDNDTVGMEGAEKLYHVLKENGYDCVIFSFDSKVKDVRKLIRLCGKDYVKKKLESYI